MGNVTWVLAVAGADNIHPLGKGFCEIHPLPRLRCRLQGVLQGCGTEADVAAALAVFARSRDRPPTLATLTKLISRLGKSNSWRIGVAVFNNLHVFNLPHAPDVQIANAALFACQRGGSAAAALAVYARMQDCNIGADRLSFKALLPVLACQHWQQSVEVRFSST